MRLKLLLSYRLTGPTAQYRVLLVDERLQGGCLVPSKDGLVQFLRKSLLTLLRHLDYQLSVALPYVETKEVEACAFAAFVCQVTPSTPAVLFPLLDVTLYRQCLCGFACDEKMLQGFHLVVLLISLRLCDSPLQLASPPLS